MGSAEGLIESMQIANNWLGTELRLWKLKYVLWLLSHQFLCEQDKSKLFSQVEISDHVPVQVKRLLQNTGAAEKDLNCSFLILWLYVGSISVMVFYPMFSSFF